MDNQVISVGHLVWAPILVGIVKMWPGVVIRERDCGKKHTNPGYVWVFCYGDYQAIQIHEKRLAPFASNFMYKYVNYPADSCYRKAVIEAIRECAYRARVYNINCDSKLLDWAKNGFRPFPEDQFLPQDPEYPLPMTVASYFAKERYDDALSLTKKPIPVSQDPNSAVQKLLKGEIIIECMCIACNREDVDIDCMHPLFVGGLCLQCKDKIKKSIFDSNNNIGISYCAICGRINSVAIACRNCNLYYCRSCLDRLVGPEGSARAKMKNVGPCCGTCARDDSRSVIIRKRKDWEENLQKLRFYHPVLQLSEPDFGNGLRKKRPIRVLALFDDLAAGSFALEANGICVEKYYVCAFGLRDLKFLYRPVVEGAHHLGDVYRLSEQQIGKICPIDLLLGTLPRGERADVLVNGCGENDDRFETTSVMFYEYYRALLSVHKLNNGHPLFWLLEAGTAMLPLLKDIACRYLGSEPVPVHVSRSTPPAHLWGNLPGLHRRVPKKVPSNVNGTKRCFVALQRIDKLHADLKRPRCVNDKALEAKDEKMFSAVVKIERCEEIANRCEEDLSDKILTRTLASLKGYFCSRK